MKKILAAILLLGTLLAGCVSPGERLEASTVERIKEGSTTRQEVEKLLGMPRSILQGSDRRVVADYSYGRLLPGATPPTVGPTAKIIGSVWERSVSVLYDENGIVMKKTFFESEQRVREGHGRIWVGHGITESDLSDIQVGVTTFKELEKRFGRPASKGLTLKGNYAYDWFYGTTQESSGLNVKRRTIQVLFENDGKVIDYRIHGTDSNLER